MSVPTAAAPAGCTRPVSPAPSGWRTPGCTVAPGVAPTTVAALQAGALGRRRPSRRAARRLRHRQVAPADRVGVAACESGRRVRYATTAALAGELVESAGERILSRAVPATAATTCSVWTSSATCTSTAAALSCCLQVLTERQERAWIAVPPTRRSASGPDVHRSPPSGRDCGPADLQRPHRGDRQPLLSPPRDPLPHERSPQAVYLPCRKPATDRPTSHHGVGHF
jgi:hypothetical protein